MDAFLALGRLQQEQSESWTGLKVASRDQTRSISPCQRDERAGDHFNQSCATKNASASEPFVKPSTVHLLQQGLRGSNAQFLSKAALHDPDNPITHSKTGERTLMIQSCASGHQTSNSNSRSGGGSWALHRNAKLSIQAQAKSSNIFEGVICYINGYTGTDAAADHPAVGLGGDDDVEDLSTGDRGHTYGVTERTWSNEMIKDAVESGGGVVRINPSARLSHVLISTGLSASKTQKVLTARLSSLSSRIKFVDPRWIVESVLAGRRLAEAKFPAPIINESQPTVVSTLGRSSRNDTDQALLEERQFRHRYRHPASYESASDVFYAQSDDGNSTDSFLGATVAMQRSRSTSALADLARQFDAEAAALMRPSTSVSDKPLGDSRPAYLSSTGYKDNAPSSSSLTGKLKPFPSLKAIKRTRTELRHTRSLHGAPNIGRSNVASESPLLPVIEIRSSSQESAIPPRRCSAVGSVESKPDIEEEEGGTDAWDMPPSAQPCKRRRKA